MTEQRKPKALIIGGDGINCENETAQAFQLAGFETEVRHINDLIIERTSLDPARHQVVAFPGGFSFGDDLSSGKVLALKIQHGLKWNLPEYAHKGGLVIGICNGFQALIRMGLFGKEISITNNQEGKFINQWVRVSPAGNRCVWLRGTGSFDLPIRHGEGRIVVHPGSRKEVTEKLSRFEMACLKYEVNPNGSEGALAGLCDVTGRIFGLMPHPEAFVRWSAHPEWTLQPNRAGAPGQGLHLFENAFQEAQSKLQ